MKYEVDEEVMQALANYLVSCPYREVFKLVEALNKVKPIEEPEPGQFNDNSEQG